MLCCKVPTITAHQTTIFCPVNTPWHIHAYDDDRLCVYYQKNQKMMDLLKHDSCLLWCGDDLHHGHTDEIRVDSCIRPLLTEYSKLKWHLLTGEGDLPIYAKLAKLYATAHTGASTDMDVDASTHTLVRDTHHSDDPGLRSMLHILHSKFS